MRPNISITLLTPHVTVERYGELTGLDSDTIKAMLADGRLTRQPRPAHVAEHATEET